MVISMCKQEKDKQYTCNVILWCIRVTILAVETQECILCFCFSPTLSNKRQDLRKKIIENKIMCFNFLYTSCLNYFLFQEEFRDM